MEMIDMEERIVIDTGWKLCTPEGDICLEVPHMPMQVHDILFAAGQIGEEYKRGRQDTCKWVSGRKWIYENRVRIPAGESGRQMRLYFGGLDTVADICVDGEFKLHVQDCYLPAALDISSVDGAEEILLQIVFPSMEEVFQGIGEQYGEIMERDRIPACRFLRKTFHDFSTYLGNEENFWKVGVFRPVELQIGRKHPLRDWRPAVVLNETLTRGRVRIELEPEEAFGEWPGEMTVEAEITLDGEVVDRICVPWADAVPLSNAVTLEVPDVRLWWPRGLGEQTLYRVTLRLHAGGEEIFAESRRIGFRRIAMPEPLHVLVNDREVKLWGGNLTPDEGHTMCEDTGRIRRILELARDANMNTLRVWGEGVPFTDLLYDLADEWGILLWQEFFLGHTQYPNVEAVKAEILAESEALVRRLRHHPSVLLWCGGNECYMSRDFAEPGREYLCSSLFEYDLKALTARLDPDRCYLYNSPFGGPYTNDPLHGDTHSYTNSWYVPGSSLPRFVSENLRVAFPPVRSLKRYMETDSLPAPQPMRHGGLPWPAEYLKITSAESWKKIPPVEEFYDPQTPEEMVYVFGMAAGIYSKRTVEHYRRGKEVWEAAGRRRCFGHLVWKLNTTFPHLYSSVLDAYLEPGIPYYFLKRAYEPLLVSVDIGDHPDVWVINDTADAVQGTCQVGLYDMAADRWEAACEFPVKALAGESVFAGRADCFGQFTRDKLIRARLVDPTGELLAAGHGFADIERHLTFPEPELRIETQGDVLLLTVQRFAHGVELTGEEDGDDFGWYFSDNYFDLFPGEEKRITVGGAHRKGSISAGAAYSTQRVTTKWRRNA